MNKKEKKLKQLLPQLTQIKGLSHDGRGIGMINQKTAFIAGALPGETVECQITHQRNQYIEAQVLNVLEASTTRTTPACPHFGVCGGCSLQYMTTDAQLALKLQTVLEQLKHFGNVIPLNIMPPLQAQPFGYRRKARLGVRYVFKKNKLLIGFREKSSRYLADLNQCLVLHPMIGERFEQLRELISSLDSSQHIPQIEVAIGDETVALVFRHLQDLSDRDQQAIIEFAKIYNFQIYLQPNPPAPVTKLWPNDAIDRLSYSLPNENLEFLFHPLDFTQINLEINRLMIGQALNWLALNKNDHVLDLFCGIGNFTLPMARHAEQVIGIEGSELMVERAKENARHNGIENVEYYAANLAQPTLSAAWLAKKHHKILLDPPRAGAKEVLPLIASVNAQRILYVSCNPATFARDAGELVHTYHYQLKKIGIMNMFPHTSHIETMAVFDKEIA